MPSCNYLVFWLYISVAMVITCVSFSCSLTVKSVFDCHLSGENIDSLNSLAIYLAIVKLCASVTFPSISSIGS